MAMKVRSVVLAFVSALCFAGLAASPQSAFAVSPVPASRYVQAGFEALQQGDAIKAVPLFTQSIESRELTPDLLANAFYNRGLAYQKLGQASNAADDYSAALNLDAMASDLRARVLYNRGLAQQQLSHATLAIEDYTSALLIDPSFSYAYLARANTLRESGQYLFSISDYERAQKYQHPDVAQVYYGEGLTYEALRRPVDAKRFYQKAIASQPDFSAAISRLNALSSFAENDELSADPVLSGTAVAANVAGSTEVLARVAPRGVEPPLGLLIEEPKIVVATAEAPAKVVVASVPKLPVIQVAVKTQVVDPIVTASTQEAAPIKTHSPLLTAANIGWAVQISSAATEDAAWASFKTMQKSHKILAGEKPVVVAAELGDKGTVYRLRLQGFDEQSAARAACAKLKAGGVSCYVAKAES